jgi:hypothetical protein
LYVRPKEVLNENNLEDLIETIKSNNVEYNNSLKSLFTKLTELGIAHD